MKYTGTIAQVEAIEDYIVNTRCTFTLNADKNRGKADRPKTELWGVPKSTFSASYEVYTNQDGWNALNDPDKWFYLIGCPSCRLRFFYSERDNLGTVAISPSDMPKLLGVFPVIAEMLQNLEYKVDQANILYEKSLDKRRARV